MTFDWHFWANSSKEWLSSPWNVNPHHYHFTEHDLLFQLPAPEFPPLTVCLAINRQKCYQDLLGSLHSPNSSLERLSTYRNYDWISDCLKNIKRIWIKNEIAGSNLINHYTQKIFDQRSLKLWSHLTLIQEAWILTSFGSLSKTFVVLFCNLYSSLMRNISYVVFHSLKLIEKFIKTLTAIWSHEVLQVLFCIRPIENAAENYTNLPPFQYEVPSATLWIVN